ncbi:HSP20-like chaperone [Podospora australis]|uniref:HSP20-like chaperone n=1 Tax=Podospora australis TaxID=1536484 RepID=A0AAN6X2W6_9PEZI|nr:HSP20-like chaperone [Podospora australis]
MSIFPRAFYNSDPSFTPLFRLLDDFDTYSREVQSTNEDNQAGRPRSVRQALKTFNPKFDIRETEASYEMHGELPGIERSNVHIEFTDPQTLVIRGRIERSYSSGTPPAGSIDGSTQSSGAITEAGEQHNTHHQPHKVTIEDEKSSEENAGTVAKNELTGNNHQQQVSKQAKAKAPFEKIWLQERSIGEFSRTFSFPSRVDHDGVTAKLEHGILNVVVPKAKKHESRIITIN